MARKNPSNFSLDNTHYNFDLTSSVPRASRLTSNERRKKDKILLSDHCYSMDVESFFKLTINDQCAVERFVRPYGLVVQQLEFPPVICEYDECVPF